MGYFKQFSIFNPTIIALVYGLVIGVISGLAFWLMNQLQHLIWHTEFADSWWYISGVIMLGGVIIALLGRKTSNISNELDEQIIGYEKLRSARRNKVLLVALSAIVAVGFGGAIGPEAGLVAIVTELSLLANLRLSRLKIERQTLIQWSTAAALSGVYLSPPAAARYASGKFSPSKRSVIIAAIAGLIGFVLVQNLLGKNGHSLAIHLPTYTAGFDLWQALLVIVPALAAGLLAVAYVKSKDTLRATCQKFKHPLILTLVLTAIFALIAIYQPMVRFSGHHDFGHILEMANHAEYGQLALLAILKLLACALCLVAGWRGGDAFPLMLAGAAAGLATSVALPELPSTAAVVTGMTSALTIGLAKPLVAMLLVTFIVAGNGLLPGCIGASVGYLLIHQFDVKKPSHH